MKNILLEATPQLSVNKVNNIIQWCIVRFFSEIAVIKPSSKFYFTIGNFYWSTRRSGTTEFGYDSQKDQLFCVLSLNKIYLEKALKILL